MVRVLLVLAVASLGVCAVWGAASGAHENPLEQCPGQNYENLREVVHVKPCGKKRCTLRKGTSTTITIRFKPTKEIANVITQVSANLAGIDLPFIGVTGSSACGQLTLADSGEAASCPLKPDVEYLYTNTFPIESYYPPTSLRVHWSLTDGTNDLICFEVPATIK